MLRLTYASIIIITVELVSKLQGRCQVEKAFFLRVENTIFFGEVWFSGREYEGARSKLTCGKGSSSGKVEI